MNYSIIEGCIRQSMDRPIDNKQIVVKEKKYKNRKDSLWVVKSHHAENINLLTRRKSLDRVDLLCLTDLGFKIKYL
jgi:S-adenosylmethionine:diacylglycerol 3-amino-3-carboxypropyl transferase|tara:strand:+ start:3698 stop:3925 length:228 start_codon:yes stop_codon:yes gene_type:complete